MRKRLGIAAIIIGLALCAVGLRFLLTPDMYQAATRIEVKHVPAPGVFDPWFLQSEFEIIQSAFLLNKVVEGLKLNEKLGQTHAESGSLNSSHAVELIRQRLASSSSGKELIDITVTDEDPLRAAIVANAIAEAFEDFRNEQREKWSVLTDAPSDEDHEIQAAPGTYVRIVAPAVPPTSPTGRNHLVGSITLTGGLIVFGFGIFMVSYGPTASA